MGVEIERKFLPSSDGWRELSAGISYRQGYLYTGSGMTVRLRIAGEKGFLTIKGPGSGASRMEFEYQIPIEDANEMLDRLCEKPLIEKNRHTIGYRGFVWEVDEFFGDNEGLVVAEIELEFEDQQFDLPEWIGEEVTGDPRYFNASLVKTPFSTWKSKC